MKLVIVDYGMGNLKSVISALNYLGYDDVTLSNEMCVLEKADKLILPGVGNYAMAMYKMNSLDLVSGIKQLALYEKKPILGICLGMQLMGVSSTESGFNTGLGLIEGVVEEFDNRELRIPHVGYNQVIPRDDSRLYSGLSANPDFYFTHSFKMSSGAEIGRSDCSYGDDFVASFELENIAGVQFHPELSQKNGLKLMKNFIELF